MEDKKGVVLNRMYTGSYLSTNLGHEVINMFQADNGNHYLYLNSKGNFGQRGNDVGTMLLVRGIGESRVEVVGMAKNLKSIESACCSLPRDLGRINESIRKAQKIFLTEGDHIVTYGNVPILNIFGEKGQQSVYVSYWVEGKDFLIPKSGMRLILEFPPSKDKSKDDESSYDLYLKKPMIEENKISKENTIITIRLKTHNFASTSLHQFILDGEDLLGLNFLCDIDSLWEYKTTTIEKNPDVSAEHDISIFDICQIQNDENRFSNALSYFILKYRELWRNLLQEHLNIKDLGEIESVTREEDAKVNKEGWNNKTGGRIDLLIRTKNYYIIIENKIGSDIIIKDNVSQLERYYNYVEYLKNEEFDRLIKEDKKVKNELTESENYYEKYKNTPKKGLHYLNKIKTHKFEQEKISANLKEVENRKTIGLVLAPNYNMPSEEERQVNDDFTYQELPYKNVYEWLSKNASKELGEDANLKAFHNAMKKHTYKYENEALYDEMKNKFFSRINEFKNKNNAKLFTKSAFKTALTCLRQLYYYYDSQTYANQNNDDGFLQALAEGGFQVGELAKIYNDITDETDIKSLDYITSLEETKRLFERDEVNIAEAAFRYKNCFVRVDLLKKNGNTLELIEVKAKSWDKDSSFTQKKNPNKIASDILPYLYDVAFQKWVVTNALKEQYPDTPYTVKAFLMMADKGQVASVDGMNQCFRISKDENKRIKIERGANAKVLKDGAHVLTAFPVDEYCDKIIRGETDEQQEVMGYKFEDFVEKMSDNYCNHKKAECQLGTQCFTCPFQTTPKDSQILKNGYKECWKEKAKFTDEDFEKPLVKDLWGAYIKRSDFIKDGKFFLKDLSPTDLKAEKIRPTVGLHHIERKLLQIGLATKNEEILKPFQPYIKDGVYIDVEGLQEEMKSWKFPLHMIDFETTAVALPFYKGLRPYEQVAFQFSHHIIRKADNGMGYTIEHAGQYLNTKKGYFPNFDFVRELKMQLEQDNGSVFRYANHENTILRSIHEQLQKSNEPDKEELLTFIDTLTHTDKVVGERDMIDLLEVVKLYFYHPIMKGSNSIKVVLPAVLNSSELLKKKYSQPIYGTEITSKNYTSDSSRTWIAYKENGEVDNPYKRLESISSLLNVSEEELSHFGESLDEAVCDGGAALAAYSKLQFSDDNISEALETALLRYCELDTLAMVFIWEYFNEMISPNKVK